MYPSVGIGIVSTSLSRPDQCSMGACLLTYGFDCCCAFTLETKIVHKLKTIASLFISSLLERELKASSQLQLEVLGHSCEVVALNRENYTIITGCGGPICFPGVGKGS